MIMRVNSSARSTFAPSSADGVTVPALPGTRQPQVDEARAVGLGEDVAGMRGQPVGVGEGRDRQLVETALLPVRERADDVALVIDAHPVELPDSGTVLVHERDFGRARELAQAVGLA